MLYFELMIECFDYCRKQKAMEIYAYCIMPNHVHLMFRSGREHPAGLIRDLKSFSARILLKAIKENNQESRKGWLLNTFRKAAIKQEGGNQYAFWQPYHHPIEL
ncbi:transposase [Robertkochia marina]